jgi:Neutral/alkaline non-lysosomal ceramidase, N-terminal
MLHLCLAVVGFMPCDSGDLRAGAATMSITPPLGIPMAGYYSERGATGVHDDLYAKALVIESGGAKAALVALDLIGTSRHFVETARQEIERTTGIPGSHVMISASHSHTGPILAKTSTRYDTQGGKNDLAVEYMAKLPGLIAQSVRQANERLAPAKLSVATGYVDGLAFNRRFHMRDGTVGWNPGKLNPNIVRPAGPTDPELPVVFIESANAQPIATYANFSIHLDTVGGTEISADAPATLSKLLAAAKDPNMVTVYTTGCCGDINHIDVSHAGPQKGHGEAARIGTVLAASILRSCENLRPIPPAAVRVRSEMVKLPLPKVDPSEIDAARVVAEQVRSRANPAPKFLDQVQAFKVLDVAARDGQPQEVEVQVIALGDELAWVSLPGEIFVQLGLTIKQGSPFRQTMIAELANGAIGYIPNRVAYPQGNYEVISARCAEGSGELLVDAALQLLRDAYNEAVKSR